MKVSTTEMRMNDDHKTMIAEKLRDAVESGHIEPDFIPVGRDTWAAYREAYCAIGPRHRIIDRWRYDLGWEVSADVAEAFLAPETRHLKLPAWGNA
jgi:hypothetical protein